MPFALTDGIYVTVVNASSGVADTLDYIGTGGALDSALNTGNDWLEYRYDLSSFPPGTSVQVCFPFISDNQSTHDGEGFYIDDVQVGQINSIPPGEVTGDGVIDIADVLYLINYLYKSGPVPYPKQAGDVTCDGQVNIDDVIFLINYLFKGGPPPPGSC